MGKEVLTDKAEKGHYELNVNTQATRLKKSQKC